MRTFFFAAAAVASMASMVSAQQINPDDVPLSLRSFWCQQQRTQCPLICTQETNGSPATYANDCEPETLVYNCICSNNLSPNASEYSQTIPFFECTEFNTQCQKNCGIGANTCAAACVQDHPCGARNPTRVNATSTTATTQLASATGATQTNADGETVYSGFGGSPATNTPNAAPLSGRFMAAGEVYGLSLVAAGIFAGFALFV